jgi:poly-gamma-glutamate synthesis protein (capsule biosynthesis protein)
LSNAAIMARRARHAEALWAARPIAHYRFMERLSSSEPTSDSWCLQGNQGQSGGTVMREPVTTLAFVGDIMLGRRVDAALAGRDPESLWGDTVPLLRASAGVVGNLECPITTHGQEWKNGWKAFRFRAGPRALDALRAANIRAVNLANNHILDFADRGLMDTLDRLDEAGIAHVGAGRDSEGAVRPAILDLPGVRLGLIGFTDNMPEFAATARGPGTAYMAIRSDAATLGVIRMLVQDLRRAGADLVVLSVHWGPNLRMRPPRRFRNFARQAAELGVDVVHGHSAHLIQGVELHNGSVILYDTGDFLDDYWIFPFIRTDRSLLFLLRLVGGRMRRLDLVPVRLTPARVMLARGREAEAIRRCMRRRCLALGTQVSDGAIGLQVALGAPSFRPAGLPTPSLWAGDAGRLLAGGPA